MGEGVNVGVGEMDNVTDGEIFSDPGGNVFSPHAVSIIMNNNIAKTINFPGVIVLSFRSLASHEKPREHANKDLSPNNGTNYTLKHNRMDFNFLINAEIYRALSTRPSEHWKNFATVQTNKIEPPRRQVFRGFLATLAHLAVKILNVQ